MCLRLLPRDGIPVAPIGRQHHGVVLDAGGRGQTVVASHATRINVDALRLHLGGVQPLGIRVIQELLLAANPVNARAGALPHIGGIVVRGLLKIARACRPRLGSRELPLRLRLAVRVVVVLDPVAGVLALGPLVLFIYQSGRVEGRVLNNGVVVGDGDAGVGGHIVILAVKAAVAHGLRAAKGRARDVGHHSKLAHRADIAIAAVQ